MAFGRPTEYEPDVHALGVAAYIKLCKGQNYLPTIEGLAVHLSIARSTIYEWAKAHPDFSDILEQLLAAQASQLIQNGLVNNYNPTITKLMLTKHNYSDKQQVDHTTDGKPIAGFNFLSNGGTHPDNPANA